MLAEISQASDVVNRTLKSMVASRTPRMIIQSGVDMEPRALKPVRRISGSQFFAFRRHRIMPVKTASMEGFIRAEDVIPGVKALWFESEEEARTAQWLLELNGVRHGKEEEQ